MSILGALKTQTNSLDDLAALPQAMIMQMAQKGQIREDMLAPILSRKAELADAVARSKALAGQGGQQPTVMEQLMAKNAEAEAPAPEAYGAGVAQLPVSEDMYSQGMAGGGIIAFNDGGDIDDEEEREERLQDYYNEQEKEGLLQELLNSQVQPQGVGIKVPSSEKTESAPIGSLKEYASQTAEKYGLDPSFVSKIIQRETGGMKNPERAVSSAGAKGVMQLMPGTAKDMGVNDVFDAAQNIEGGIKYLAMLNKKYDDEKLAAIAYNWGPGNTDKWLKAGADVNKLPAETRKYIANLASGGEVRGYAKGDLIASLAPGEEIVPESELTPTAPKSAYDAYMQSLIDRRKEIKDAAEQDKYMALVAAGLGMMGGTSANALTNIGAGGAKGLEQLAQSRKLRAAEETALNKAELGGLSAKETERYRNELMKERERKLQEQTESKKEDLQSKTITKVEGMINRNPIVLDMKKKMELLDPSDPMYEFYANEIEKVYANAYKNAGIKTDRLSVKPAKPPAPKVEEGFWSKLFGSSKPSSGGTMKFDAQGNPI